MLHALGGLRLPGTKLKRPKPLLLLCYLALNGPQERRHLAELFWKNREGGLANLSTNLYRIHKDAPGCITSDEARVWVTDTFKTDVQELRKSLQQDTFGISLYPGAFVAGVDFADLSSELEDWISRTRNELASKVQKALLEQAEQMASLGQFSQAAERANDLLNLTASSTPTSEDALLEPEDLQLEPEDLLRCYLLLHAGEHERAKTVREELTDYDIHLSISSSEAKERLRQIFVGRKAELGNLSGLAAGQWAWLKGGSGLGKTSLLQKLSGRYLAGQSGLPFATLEPLVGEVVQNGSEAILRRLSRQEETLLVDDWEQADPESQDIFKRLRTLKGTLRVVIASSQPPAFGVNKLIELSPLSAEDLESSLWQQTGGVPILVGAHLRGESLEAALATLLHSLSEKARHLYLSLALLQEPEIGLAKRALKLSSSDFADALEELMGAGLAQASGKVWPRQLARNYVQSRPSLLGQLALSLARVLENTQALPLYQLTKALWTDEDIPKVQAVYAELAEETLQRGFPKRAAEIIDEVPLNDELRLLKARALENIGLYKKALEALGDTQTPKARAFRGRLLWRVGEHEQAEKIAGELKNSRDIEIRAEALYTLGLLAYSKSSYAVAEEHFGRSAALWQTLNNKILWAETVINIAWARTDGLQPIERVEEKLQEATEIAGNNSILQSTILLNRAYTYEKRGYKEEAIKWFRQTIISAREAGTKHTEARAWNNLGVIFHKDNLKQEAQEAYEKTFLLARELNETLTMGVILANLAELTNNPDAWEEAIRILEDGGHYSMAERYKNNTTYHPVRPRLDPQD